MKPKLKHIYPVIKFSHGFQIGDEPNFAVEIEDENNLFIKLIDLLDGSNNVENIYNCMKIDYPISFTEIQEIIESLNDMGVLENGEDTFANESEILRKKYNNNINYFSAFSNLNKSKFSFQEKLCETKVLVIGMGGLGSNVLYQLSGLGVGNIVTVDFDDIEHKNLNRQILYSENNIGKKKTDIGIERLKEFNSSINFNSYERKINCEED